MGGPLGRRMYRCTKTNAPKRILEVGTCAAIGATYMLGGAVAASVAADGWCEGVRFVGTEGVRSKWEHACDTLHTFFPDINWVVHNIDFDSQLRETIAAGAPFDFAYIDGQHDGEKTIRNFEWVLSAMPAGGIVVLDDLNGPRQMTKVAPFIIKLCHRVESYVRWNSSVMAVQIRQL